MLKSKNPHQLDNGIVAVKSKFDADIIRFSVNKNEAIIYEDFAKLLAERHELVPDKDFLIWYTDPTDGDLLPINNNNNLEKALQSAKPLLRVIIQRKGNGMHDLSSDHGRAKPNSIISSILYGTPVKTKHQLAISQPHDFRQVSAIIDVDKLPATCRRVRLLKHGSDKPLGFYIKDYQKLPGVFISRLVPGGLAESTGLLAVNDEVLEVNGIEVADKTLDQVTDMMIANSSNLIITVRPANQRAAMMAPRRGSFSRNSQLSAGSHAESMQSAATGSDDDADEIVDLTGIPMQFEGEASSSSTTYHHCYSND